jgi:hydrogenase nickel incorporation protein HypA/HybF
MNLIVLVVHRKMHELSLAVSIIETAIKAAKEHDATKILEINVEIGDLTVVSEDRLRFTLDITSKDTIAEGAKINIERKPGRIRCMKCGYEGESNPPTEDDPIQHLLMSSLKCPKCGDTHTEIIGGRELGVTDIIASK